MLENDTDIDGDALTITDINFNSFHYGYLFYAEDLGAFFYEQLYDFTGTFSFTYTVSDRNGGTDTATVTITVTPVDDN